MPQLNTLLWFQIFTFSWLTFLILLPPKVLSRVFPNEAIRKASNFLKSFIWSWPWQ